MKKRYNVSSQKETQEIAHTFAKSLTSGDIVLLYGDLGAGKTFFIREVVKALEYEGLVSSPSFVLHHIYLLEEKQNIKKIHHLDLYRLSSEDDLESIGIQDILNDKESVIFIEWPQKLKKLPHSFLRVELTQGQGLQERQITISQISSE